ncbi:MAG: NitT/TauT family transport system permease protein [Alphaproteobacteria bacterium]|jgi:NitT/TauT family transport system permease protein|nr:NitT/TauT family transport system permease protein [Alphaproteobacteria bacterium]
MQVAAIAITIAVGAIAFLFVANWIYPFLPSPLAVLHAAFDLAAQQDLYRHFGVTMYESLAGLAIATVLGIGLGVLTGANRTATEFLTPIVLALYSIPKIILLPILLMIFGAGLPPKIANAALHAFFPVLLNSLVGMREISRIHLKVARSMSASRAQMASKVYLPGMVLPVFAGIKLALGLAVMGALLAELFEANAGVGYFITQFYNKGQIAEMIAIVVVLFALILAINAAMARVENRLSRWRRP